MGKFQISSFFAGFVDTKALQRLRSTWMQLHYLYASKVQGNRSPLDGDWRYWATRMGKHPELSTQIAKLLKHQHGKCSDCELYFRSEDLLEVHHVDGNHQNHKWDNLVLLHQHCHNQVHSGMRDQHPVVEEPCEVNVSITVL